MFEARRQHPVAALTKVLEIIRGNFITILLIIFVGGGSDEEALLNLTWILGAIVVLLVWGILSWLRFTYRIDEDELVIEQGVLIRQNLYISRDRIQVIDISSGLIQRMFGLVEVEVKTAGSSSKEAKISAVTQEMAHQLRNQLRQENGNTPATDQEAAGEDSYEEIYKLNTRDLVIAASTSGRFGIALSIVGTVFSQVDQVVSDERMFSFLESVMPSSPSTSLVMTSLMLILVVSWVLSFLGTLVTYGNFSVRVGGDELMIAHGIFEQKQLTVPYNRIQAIQIKEGLLRQPLGYLSLQLDSAGYGDEAGRSVTLFPLLPRSELRTFLTHVLPEYDKRVQMESPPGRSLRRYLFRMGLAGTGGTLALTLLLPLGWYATLLLIPALVLGYAQFKDGAVGVNGETMMLRYRLISRTTVFVKRYRLQTVQLEVNPFQRRRKLAHYSVTVASGKEGHQFTVRDLDIAYAFGMWEWASDNGREDGDIDSVSDSQPNTPPEL